MKWWVNPWSAPSAICTALCPDDARSGYPWATQRWDRNRKMWRWSTLGIGDYYGGKTGKYLEPGERYVWVKRWVRAKSGGWRAVIDKSRTVYPEPR